MTADHVGDIVMWSTAAGVAGMLALLAFGVLQTRWRDHGTLTALPAAARKRWA